MIYKIITTYYFYFLRLKKAKAIAAKAIVISLNTTSKEERLNKNDMKFITIHSNTSNAESISLKSSSEVYTFSILFHNINSMFTIRSGHFSQTL